MLNDFFLVLCLVLILEGLLVALMPTKLRSIFTILTAVPLPVLRYGGLVVTGLGVFLIWYGR